MTLQELQKKLGEQVELITDTKATYAMKKANAEIKEICQNCEHYPL